MLVQEWEGLRMLNMKNKEDIQKMMKYHRTRDMLNLLEYFKEYRTYIISDSDYQKSRRQRVSFLTSGEISLPLNIVEENTPKHYSEIPNFIWLDVMKNLIKKLESKEELLASNGFFEFGISGHTEGRRFLPWQMFDKSRYVLSKTK